MTNTNEEPKRGWEERYDAMCIVNVFGECKYWKFEDRKDGEAFNTGTDKFFPEEIKAFIKQVEDEATRRTVMKVREEMLEQVRKPREILPENQPEIYRDRRQVAHDLGYSKGCNDMLALPSLTITKEEK